MLLLLIITTLLFAKRSIQSCTLCENCIIPPQIANGPPEHGTKAFPSSEWLLATCDETNATIDIRDCVAEDLEDALNDNYSTIRQSDMECSITTVDGENEMKYTCDVKDTGNQYSGSIIAENGMLKCRSNTNPSLSARQLPGLAKQTSSVELRSRASNMTSILPSPTPTPMSVASNATMAANRSCTGTERNPFPTKGAPDNCRHRSWAITTSDGSRITCKTLMREIAIGLGVCAMLVLLDFLDVSWGL
ncbi:hypothetical protein F5Y18DRAFT_432486 [Xylariaceae sp. FL1019]|nr:hypothetical protein F5Y18DRAFT_432486 [Xylariaceae sp. FL1019]